MNIRNYWFDKMFSGAFFDRFLVSRIKGKGLSLMYHEVLPDDEGLPAWTVVKETCFRKQIIFLKQYFDIVTIDEAISRTYSQAMSRKPYVTITFDDGYKGNYSCVLPIIEELGVPITIYVSSSAIEKEQSYWYDKIISLLHNDEPFTVDLADYNMGKYKLDVVNSEKERWASIQSLLTAMKKINPVEREKIVEKICDQVTCDGFKQLKLMTVAELKLLASSDLVTIGGHSHCHNILTQLTDKEINASLQENRNLLQQWTSGDIIHFAYPNGNFNDKVIDFVKENGFLSAVTVNPGYWSAEKSPMLLPRFGVGRFDSFGLFKRFLFC